MAAKSSLSPGHAVGGIGCWKGRVDLDLFGLDWLIDLRKERIMKMLVCFGCGATFGHVLVLEV